MHEMVFCTLLFQLFSSCKSLHWGENPQILIWIAAQSVTHSRRASTVFFVGFVSWYRCTDTDYGI